MKLVGTKTDGAGFSLSVTARTTWVKLWQQQDVATLELDGIDQAAPRLEIFESGHEGPIRFGHPGALALLPALRELALAVDGETDVSVLAACSSLKALSLSIWNRDAFDTTQLPPVESLSLKFHGRAPTIDTAPLTHVRRLSVGGLGNVELAIPPQTESFYVDHSPNLAKLVLPKLRTFNLIDCAGLKEIDTSAVAGGPLEVFHVASAPSLETLPIIPLGQTQLRTFTLVNHGLRWVDVTPLAKLATLRGFQADGKDPPFLDASEKIVSPALRQWDQAGQLQREL